MYQDACGAELRTGAVKAFGYLVNPAFGIYFIGGGAPLQDRELVEFAVGALTVVAVAGGTGAGRITGTVQRSW